MKLNVLEYQHCSPQRSKLQFRAWIFVLHASFVLRFVCEQLPLLLLHSLSTLMIQNTHSLNYN